MLPIYSRRLIFGVMVLRSKVRADSELRHPHPLVDPLPVLLVERVVEELTNKTVKLDAVVSDPETAKRAVTMALKTAHRQCRQSGEAGLFAWSAWQQK